MAKIVCHDGTLRTIELRVERPVADSKGRSAGLAFGTNKLVPECLGIAKRPENGLSYDETDGGPDQPRTKMAKCVVASNINIFGFCR
jgi:hypothetical protein